MKKLLLITIISIANLSAQTNKESMYLLDSNILTGINAWCVAGYVFLQAEGGEELTQMFSYKDIGRGALISLPMKCRDYKKSAKEESDRNE